MDGKLSCDQAATWQHGRYGSTWHDCTIFCDQALLTWSKNPVVSRAIRATMNMLHKWYPQPRKSLQHVLWNYTSRWKRSATTPNPAWPCNTALPNGTLAIRCSFSYLRKASFGSTSQWKRWWQTLQQSLCPWTSFYHRVAVPNGTALIAALCSLHISMTLQHSASQWNASDQMLIFLSTKSIFWQHFTMETLMANTAAKPVCLNFVLPPLK